MNIGTHFFQDKPLFGLDIGFSSCKVMQIEWISKKPHIFGYGVGRFESANVKDGVIINPESLAQSIKNLFETRIVGDIATNRVAIGVPASRTFSRVIKLPKLSNQELDEAVRTEAEQYIPLPVESLYLDFEIINRTDKEIELFAVAVPKDIIDSYMLLTRLLGLEVVAMETTIASAARLFAKTNMNDIPTVLIDFGSISTDITIFDKTLIVTGTVSGGGDIFAEEIAKHLNVTKAEATVIKNKYGLDFSKKQDEILSALQSLLDQLLKEIRRMIRYYEERYGSAKKISQVVIMGGGANMPGLGNYLTNSLRLPVRMTDPWQHIDHSMLPTPNLVDRSMFVTVSGLALANPKEVFS